MSTVSNFTLRTKLRQSHVCRCKFWVVCGKKNCHHYENHTPNANHCILLSPVKWCEVVKGFVHCVDISELDAAYECDPNLSFKAKREAENRNWGSPEAWKRSQRNRKDTDDYF